MINGTKNKSVKSQSSKTSQIIKQINHQDKFVIIGFLWRTNVLQWCKEGGKKRKRERENYWIFSNQFINFNSIASVSITQRSANWSYALLRAGTRVSCDPPLTLNIFLFIRKITKPYPRPPIILAPNLERGQYTPALALLPILTVHFFSKYGLSSVSSPILSSIEKPI